MIKLISANICPFVQRVAALLAAKKTPYRIEFIHLAHKPQWFLELSPNGQVPVLITENREVLFESDAIVEYLDEVTPPIETGVDPVQRARDRAWSYQAGKHYLVQCRAQRSADEKTFLERQEKLGRAFARAEKALGAGPFFKGDRLSNVDIAWLPLLHRAGLIQKYTGFDFLDPYPGVKKWQRALLETGLAEKSVAADFEAAFTRFYLSEETFLGSKSALNHR